MRKAKRLTSAQRMEVALGKIMLFAQMKNLSARDIEGMFNAAIAAGQILARQCSPRALRELRRDPVKQINAPREAGGKAGALLGRGQEGGSR